MTDNPNYTEKPAPECPDCGMTIDEAWTFCPYCGERIDWWTVWGCGE